MTEKAILIFRLYRLFSTLIKKNRNKKQKLTGEKKCRMVVEIITQLRE